jgi:hypothetical protein
LAQPQEHASWVASWSSYRSASEAGRFITTPPMERRSTFSRERGRIQIGDRVMPMRAGDYIALLAGPRGAHQTFNDSDAMLRYLCLSTMIEPDVNFYPESRKIGFSAGSAPGGHRAQRFLEGPVPAGVRGFTGLAKAKNEARRVSVVEGFHASF